MSRVVVVGAGPGGLSSAARLASQGHQVTLLEQGPRLGGKLHTYRRDGFAFDEGPSLFTLPQVYRDLFAATGRPLDEVLDVRPLEPAFGITWADATHAVVPGQDPERCAAALGDALGGTAAEDWRRLMRRAEAMWELTRTPFLERPLAGVSTLLSLAKRPSDIATVAPFRTLRALGSATLRDPRLVTLLDRYATYTGSDPRRAPAVFATVPFMEQQYGAWHIAGGLGRLAEEIEVRCSELGVDVRTGQDVREILLSGGRVSGVRLADGDRIPADVVVANTDATLLYRHLLPADRRAARLARRLERNPPSLAGFVLLLAVQGRTPGIQHHNVWFPARYDDEFDAIFGSRPHPVEDPTIYACVPNDPQMRPEGNEAWFILVNAPRQGDGSPGALDWSLPGFAEAYADKVLALLAERGVDLRPRLLWREIRTPVDFATNVRAPHGIIYGAASHGPRAAFQRPANASPIPGLFLVGGSAHPGGGLPLVGMSAAIVAGLVGHA